MEKAEDTDPHIERFIDQCPIIADRCQGIEKQERQRKDAIGGRYQQSQRETRNECAIQGDDTGTNEKVERPQPAHLSIGPVARHGISHRAQDVIGGHEQHDEQK